MVARGVFMFKTGRYSLLYYYHHHHDLKFMFHAGMDWMVCQGPVILRASLCSMSAVAWFLQLNALHNTNLVSTGCFFFVCYLYMWGWQVTYKMGKNEKKGREKKPLSINWWWPRVFEKEERWLFFNVWG